MYEFSVLARYTFDARSNSLCGSYEADPLDRQEWEAFLPLVTALARWKSIRHKRALERARVSASPARVTPLQVGAHPSCQ